MVVPFIIAFSATITVPVTKLSNEPISSPGVCLPSLVFRIACTGMIAPTKNVITIKRYLYRLFIDLMISCAIDLFYVAGGSI